MKRVLEVVITIFIIVISTNCFADCNCDDWVRRGGYCVDYIKSKIPIFPTPSDVTAIKSLKNKELKDVEKGNVAIFNLGTYWHVAYVEKVHLNLHGNATAVDVSEMNFGRKISFEELKNKWGPATESEWKRAICCGVTDTYDQTSIRKNVEISSIQQIWSSETSAFQNFKSLARFSTPWE